MIFNSLDFILFALIVLPLFFLVSYKIRWVLLLIASYFFYMYWEPSYIVLILISTVVDYFISHNMAKTSDKGKRKLLLIGSLVVNLGLLFTFKYFNFFQDTIASVLSVVNVSYQPTDLDVLLPVGISFYTFQTLSYTIDVYWRKIKPERHFGKFALYVSFFPQLVAGPIERASNLLPQMAEIKQKFTSNNFIAGFSQVVFGFFKKVVVADTLAIFVNSIYNNYELHSGTSLLIATYAFAFQIYCDFSGYSDIAIGTARIMGFKFRENFNIPYFSKSVTEFWRRWHISLSSWLKDYLYIPLGGNRKGKFKTYQNLFITMLLGGLWHGASWNFVVWGALNGIYLAIEKFLNIRKADRNSSFIKRLIYSFFTFHLICFTWIFFRAQSFEQSSTIVSKIFNVTNLGPLSIQDTSVFGSMVLGLIVLLSLEYGIFRKKEIKTFAIANPTTASVICGVLFVLILLFGISEGSQFIYFQF